VQWGWVDSAVQCSGVGVDSGACSAVQCSAVGLGWGDYTTHSFLLLKTSIEDNPPSEHLLPESLYYSS